jgi:hypothetical protein
MKLFFQMKNAKNHKNKSVHDYFVSKVKERAHNINGDTLADMKN